MWEGGSVLQRHCASSPAPTAAKRNTKVERLIKQASWARVAIRACLPHGRPSKSKQKRALLHDLPCTTFCTSNAPCWPSHLFRVSLQIILKRGLSFKDTWHLSRLHNQFCGLVHGSQCPAVPLSCLLAHHA